jgi:hypothetical protein
VQYCNMSRLYDPADEKALYDVTALTTVVDESKTFIQTITSTSTVILPVTSLVLLQHTVATLANADSDGITIQIRNTHGRSKACVVTTLKGSIYFAAGSEMKTLIYTTNGWMITRGGSFFPTTLEEKLVGTGATGNAYQGLSVAISADGNTVAVGAADDNSNVGATWVFEKSDGEWDSGTKVVGTGNTGASYQGSSCSLSADGTILAVGGYGNNSGVGATWIFQKTSGVWAQVDKLIGTGYGGSAPLQGSACSLSADGTILAVGGNGDTSNAGATWIFQNSGTWTQITRLVGTSAVGTSSSQGSSCSLSANGKILAVGGPGDNSGAGATWIFENINGTWTQITKLIGASAIGAATQGYSCSLSANGTVLAVGGYTDNTNIGAIWVFVRENGIWNAGIKLIASTTASSQQGYCVSLSADGNTLATGGATTSGAAWTFTRSNGTWDLTSTLDVDGADLARARSCALSSDGSTIAIGNNYTAAGGTHIYV